MGNTNSFNPHTYRKHDLRYCQIESEKTLIFQSNNFRLMERLKAAEELSHGAVY